MAVHDLQKGREYNRNKAMEGFDKVNVPRIARAVHQSGYADVLLRPTMVGVLRCGKMLPPQLNLVTQIEFADGTASRAAKVTAPRRAAAILESTSEEVSTADCRPLRGQGAGVRLGGLQARDGGVSARELGGQRCGGHAQDGVGHLGVDLQRRDPRSDVEGVLVHHGLEAVVGGHRGQRGVVGRGDGAVHGRRGAVIRQLQVHAVGGALRGHHALQHVEGRLVCLVGETRGQRALQRGDAASVPARPWWPHTLQDPCYTSYMGYMVSKLGIEATPSR